MSNSDFREVSTEYIQDRIQWSYRVHNRTGRSTVYSIVGPPGVGKSALARCAAADTAETLGLDFAPDKVAPDETEFGFLSVEFSDIGEEVGAGLPFMDFDTGIIRRGVEPIWPTQGRGILLLDEWAQEKWAQKHVSKLISKRKSGGVTIPPGWMLVLAGNAAEHRAGVQRTLTHTQNRFCEVRVRPEVATALRYFRQPASPEVSVYLSWFPNALHSFDPTEQGPYPTPRVWDHVNDLIIDGADIVGESISESDYALFQGYLGTGLATDLRTFVSAIQNLPNADDMVRNPSKYASQMRSMDGTTVMAVVALCAKRYQQDRDLRTADAMIELTSYHRAEMVGAALSLARRIDEQAGDGVSVHDGQAYARFVTDNPGLFH